MAQTVYVNTTAINSGFNGTVDITSDGTLSVDGGASTVPINFSGNQVVTNSVTGAVTNINTTNVSLTGTDSLTYTGTFDVFQALATLRDDLNNTAGLSSTAQGAAIQQQISELSRISDNVQQVVGEQSSSCRTSLPSIRTSRPISSRTSNFISTVQSADATSAVINLQEQENLFQATLGASAKVLGLSLLNYL